MLATIIWWATVEIGYTSLLCIALFALTGVMTPTEAFAASWGSWLVLFVFACFGLSECLRLTGFSRRFAVWFITRPFTAGHPWILVAMLLLSCTLLGCVLSGAATCIVFITIAEPILESLGYKKGSATAAMLMMGIAWASTASMSMTPIAHGGNVLMMEWIQKDFGYTISFVGWIILGIPIGLLVYLVLLGIFRYIVRPDVSRISSITADYIREKVGALGAMKLEEKLSLVIFLGVVVCWILPSVLGDKLSQLSAYFNSMGYAIPPLVGASLLCVVRVKNKPLMSFQQWMEGIEWSSISLLAAIMIMATTIGNPDTGLTQFLTLVFQPIAKAVPFYVFLLISVLWVVLQTNIMSNLVSMTLVYTIMSPIAGAMAGANMAAFGSTIAIAANYAFSLPSATTAVAIVIGSGWVPVSFLVRYGLISIIPIVLLLTFICYPFATMIFH